MKLSVGSVKCLFLFVLSLKYYSLHFSFCSGLCCLEQKYSDKFLPKKLLFLGTNPTGTDAEYVQRAKWLRSSSLVTLYRLVVVVQHCFTCKNTLEGYSLLMDDFLKASLRNYQFVNVNKIREIITESRRRRTASVSISWDTNVDVVKKSPY